MKKKNTQKRRGAEGICGTLVPQNTQANYFQYVPPYLPYVPVYSKQDVITATLIIWKNCRKPRETDVAIAKKTESSHLL